MLDYHLHLWPHDRHDVPLIVDQVASYCERASARGVKEIAITEHFFRFRQGIDAVGPFWETKEIAPTFASSMKAYIGEHCHADLDQYVEIVLEAKRQGLPVVLGLEVDYYRTRMDKVADLLAHYPFDVLLGSVHWIGGWRFDCLDDPISLAGWTSIQLESAWDAYADAVKELAESNTCDVLAHPDLIKVSGRQPHRPGEWWERIAEALSQAKMSAEISSAGWREPPNEQYPAMGLITRLLAKGVSFTTASDAHHDELVADRADDLSRILAQAGIARLTGYRRRVAHTLDLTKQDETKRERTKQEKAEEN
jgi:histidinol-phosphatase (PHP family)